MSKILSTGADIPWADTPQGRHPLQADTPSADTALGRQPSRKTPPRQTPHLGRQSPGKTPLLGRPPTPWADIPLGRHPPGQKTLPPWVDTPPGRHPSPLLAGRHPPPQQTATAVDGMHPTGMHSCKLLLQLSVARISVYHDEFHFVLKLVQFLYYFH